MSTGVGWTGGPSDGSGSLSHCPTMTEMNYKSGDEGTILLFTVLKSEEIPGITLTLAVQF